MGTEHFRESPEADLLLRVAIPASAWAMLFAFFAVAGSVTPRELGRMSSRGPSASTLVATAAQLRGAAAAGASRAERPATVAGRRPLREPVDAGNSAAP